MATIKVTNKDFYNAFIALANGKEIAMTPAQVTEWCEKKIAQLEKKSATGSGKLTKTQEANAEYKEIILEILINNGGYMTITEIKAENETFSTWDGSQKMSALLAQLIKIGKVEKITEKRVTRFKAVEVDETAEGDEITE